jgi:hypothetical protein
MICVGTAPMITQTDIADLAVLVLGVCAAKWQACVREGDRRARIPVSEPGARAHGRRPSPTWGDGPERMGEAGGAVFDATHSQRKRRLLRAGGPRSQIAIAASLIRLKLARSERRGQTRRHMAA